MSDNISIKGARVNNLKNISLEIPRGKFIVITGVSGSGKSSLAFDTLFAEGQRRFAESLSSYARQFLGRMSKPDVDLIEGIPPAIAIEQKVTVRNVRSTVATTTEIYDYLRLIFARIGRTFSPVSGREVKSSDIPDVIAYLKSLATQGASRLAYVLADLGWEEREDKVELMLSLKEEGYTRLYADGAPVRIDDVLRMDGAYPRKASLLLDRVRLDGAFDEDTLSRLQSSVAEAFRRSDGLVEVCADNGQSKSFSNRFELDGIKFLRPEDHLFSFNSPLGACQTCGGLGQTIDISEDLVIPDKSKSIYDGAIACWKGEKMGWFRDNLIKHAPSYGISIFEPYCNLPQEHKDIIWNTHSVEGKDSLVGIREFFAWVESQRYKIQYKYMLSRYSGKTVCPDCQGSRLRKEALWVKVGGINIHQFLTKTVEEAIAFLENIQLSDYEREIVAEPLSELLSRLHCIEDVGLGYLTLNRACNTLSGGETQRINLVTALGSSLVGSMYILDEPSIGLHPRDTQRLISVLRRLRDLGNTVLVVEHDEEIIRAADLLIDMGPRAGSGGGEVVFQGKVDAHALNPEALAASLTLQYIGGQRERYSRKKRNWQYSISVEGAMEHNLKDITVRFPLDVLTVVTGVSGSGKSSLVGDVLYPALFRRLNDAGEKPGVFRRLSGNLDRITRVEYVDQNPIGRSSRSNAATYLKVYDDIRKLMARQQYAKINGYGPNYFSFNAEGGRCPECHGNGFVRISMQFMSDVEMVCEECKGKRFRPEVLEVRYRGLNVSEILDLSVDEAVDFFSAGPESEAQSVASRLKALQDVGLGYIKLGQGSSTLSGGENQRIKLAYFLTLSRQSVKGEKILFVFDEPTTGLHFFDVEKLLKAFDALLENGHSLLVVEHNPDVIRAADWVIDLGPDAGAKGGEVVFEGGVEELMNCPGSLTARALKG